MFIAFCINIEVKNTRKFEIKKRNFLKIYLIKNFIYLFFNFIIDFLYFSILIH